MMNPLRSRSMGVMKPFCSTDICRESPCPVYLYWMQAPSRLPEAGDRTARGLD